MTFKERILQEAEFKGSPIKDPIKDSDKPAPEKGRMESMDKKPEKENDVPVQKSLVGDIMKSSISYRDPTANGDGKSSRYQDTDNNLATKDNQVNSFLQRYNNPSKLQM